MNSGPLPAVHPERTGDAACLLWRTADGPSSPGWPEHVAAAFADLTATGAARATATPQGVLVALAAGCGWRELAPTVRLAVQAAATSAAADRASAPAAGPDRTAALVAAAREAVTSVGRYAAGHGGGVELVEVTGDVVRVRLHGTCHGCPAAAVTVHGRLEAALTAAVPWCAGVEVVGQPRRWLSRTA